MIGVREISALAASFSIVALMALTARSSSAQPLDPGAWGSDHVGKPVPSFTSGDECLFCHRDVGPGWATNRHGQTIGTIEPNSALLQEVARSPQFTAFAGQVQFVLGRNDNQRFLRRSAEHGHLDLLFKEGAQWDSKTFG